MMTALIYTYPPDYVMASQVARGLLALGVRPLLAIDARDPRLAVEGVEVIRTSFDRQKNLNGRDFILGNLRLMQEHATGDYTLKVDSDTLVLSLEFLAGRTEIAVGVWTTQMQGCCYALRTEALPDLIAEAEQAVPPGVWLMEDAVTGELAKRLGPCHLPQRPEPTRYATYRPGTTRAEYRQRGECVVNFPLRKDRGRRAIAKAMGEFLI